MNKLYKLIQDITLEDILELEKNDPTFTPLISLYNEINDKGFFLSLITTNALICYQLSSSGEEYWREFGDKAGKYNYQDMNDIFNFFIDFLPKSKGNKRLVPTKLKRLEKLRNFLSDFSDHESDFYNDMISLQTALGKTMKQKKTDKTIVFAVKMFGYGARIRFKEIKIYPKEINIPIDSRLENIYKTYKGNEKNSILFYDKLCKKLKLPPLHLDAVLWVNYEKFMNQKV